MKWNIAGECVSAVVLSIIWIYSRKGNELPSLKNRMFQSCFFMTFVAMFSNILSTTMLFYPEVFPVFLTRLVTSVYFVTTPLMGVAYYSYTAAVVYEHASRIQIPVWLGLIPGVLYLLLALSSPFTGWLFYIDGNGVYIQGPLILTTYLVFYFYCLASFLTSLIKRRWVERQIRWILASFPIVAVVTIIIQQFYPTIILTGSAATSVLLLLYLHLQNKQLSIDYLTGLPNRQEFRKMLELKLRGLNKPPFTVAVLSLRDFKQINDTFGQQNGDAFLQAICSYLHCIAEPRSLYRFGGDEFAILMENSDETAIKTLIQKLRARLASPWQAKELCCIIRGVIGVVRYPESADTMEGLIGGIEYAVSRAKADRTKTVCYCDQEMLLEIKRRGQVLDILREKLRSDSFELYYQPIVDAKTGRCCLAESLLRIPESPLGPIYPNEFIPIAEETGLIVEITYQILHKVCRFVSRLEELGIRLDGVHVNFSGVQFTQENLCNTVSEILTHTHTPSSKICIEITESVLAENSHVVTEFASCMRGQGVLFGLDDFGTGYSNIVSVLDTPMDIIKIDKSLLWSSMENSRSEIMLRSLIRIFHELGLLALVEGVETKEQEALAKDCGIDLIQGYYYAKPMPEEAAIAFLQKMALNNLPATF